MKTYGGILFHTYRAAVMIYTSLLCHIHTALLDIIKVFYSPTDAQVNCLKNNFKIYIKTAPTCFGAISTGSALFELAKVTVVKIIN
jgi:hypothetical protein